MKLSKRKRIIKSMFIYNDKAVRYFGDNLESQKK